MSIITPFIAPILAIVIGVPVGIALFRPLANRTAASWVLPACIALACVAAGFQLVGQTLCDLGMSFGVIKTLDAVCYFAFFVAFAGAWVLSGASRKRFALLALIPIALLGPLEMALTVLSWGVGEYRP